MVTLYLLNSLPQTFCSVLEKAKQVILVKFCQLMKSQYLKCTLYKVQLVNCRAGLPQVSYRISENRQQEKNALEEQMEMYVLNASNINLGQSQRPTKQDLSLWLEHLINVQQGGQTGSGSLMFQFQGICQPHAQPQFSGSQRVTVSSH